MFDSRVRTRRNSMMTNQIFQIDAPSAQDLATFHRDGYVAFPGIFTEAGRAGLLDETVNHEQIADFIHKSDLERSTLPQPYQLLVRDWNNKGFWSDQLFDAPLVKALLQAVIGDHYHFCHSTLHVSLRGTPPLHFHQDHHHWKHENPINLAERERWYIQMLYYPNGFTRGDRSLAVIPGSQRVLPTPDVTLDKLLVGTYDALAGQPLKVEQLELPPGSMVFLNARTFHAVAPKPLDSPQPFRIFLNYIFKEAGPPHRWAQVVPLEWLAHANPHRQMLFRRDPYTPGCWD